MTTARRWCIVAVGLVILVAGPHTLDLLPVHQLDVSAAALLLKAQSSGAVAYSGDVESTGTLKLPVSNQFSDVSDLLGARTSLRVWWRGADDWRVDKLTTTGETDLFHDGRGTTSWSYEANRAVRTLNSPVRLPRASDLLPPVLSEFVLDGARTDQVVRLETARIAGVDAPGMRMRPSDAQSSIDHVDIWIEPSSGLPLKVAIFAKGADVAALTTTFLDVSLAPPPATETSFSPPPGAEVRFEATVDIAAAANRYAPLTAPTRLAGLSRHDTGPGAVGVYGRGVTQLFAVPLWPPAADPLRAQLAVTPGSAVTHTGMTLSVGPLNLLLTSPVYADHSWLLAGTVTSQTLADAATELASQPPRLRLHSIVSDGQP